MASFSQSDYVKARKQSLYDTVAQLVEELAGHDADTGALDARVEAFLVLAGAEFSQWIFDNPQANQSCEAHASLWSDVFWPMVRCYKELASSATDSQRRLDVVCKNLHRFYKVFVTRAIENYGYTPELRYIAAALKLTPLVYDEWVEKRTALSVWLVSGSLCYMGNLNQCRYLSDGCFADDAEYLEVMTYFRLSMKILPFGETLYDQGTTASHHQDPFTSAYYFLLSFNVRKGIAVKGKKQFQRQCKSILDSGFLQSTLEGIDGSLDYSLKLLLVDFFQFYSANSSSSTAVSDVSTVLNRMKDLVQANDIPSHLLTKISIIQVVMTKAFESKSAEPYSQFLSFTLKSLELFLDIALDLADFKGIFRSTGGKVNSVIALLLPSFRVYFSWLKHGWVKSWQDIYPCDKVLTKLIRFLEHLRKARGFEFGLKTATPATMWSRLEMILSSSQKQDSDDVSKEWLLYDNEEESQCLGLNVFSGELDFPSGIKAPPRGDKRALEAYRIQCLLFTGYGLTKMKNSFVQLAVSKQEVCFRPAGILLPAPTVSASPGKKPIVLLARNPTMNGQDRVSLKSLPTTPKKQILKRGVDGIADATVRLNIANGGPDSQSESEEELVFCGRKT